LRRLGPITSSLAASGSASALHERFSPTYPAQAISRGDATHPRRLPYLCFRRTWLFLLERYAGMAISGTGIPAGTYVVNAAAVYNTSMQLTAYNVTLNQGVTQALTSANSLTFAGLITPATWGQVRQVTFTPKRDFYVGDPIPCYVAANGYFGIRGNWSFSPAQIALADYPSYSSGTTRLAICGFTEASNRGSGLANLTLASLALTNTGGGYWPPAMTLGLVSDLSPHGAVVIAGDSIAAGTGDTPDSIAPRFGAIRCSISVA
jgi:hypothetical protein